MGAPATPPPLLRVAAGLLRDGDRLLACQRSAGGAHPGRWEFPGGKIEPGESAASCLERELREELAIEAEVGELLEITHFQYPDGPHVEVHFYAVRAYHGTIVNRVFAQIVWQPAARLDELDFLEADRAIVAKLVRAGR